MNELMRVALVINTNHSKFITNLMNMVVYILCENEGQMSVSQIQQYLEENLFLTFTMAEIKDAIKEGKKYSYIEEIEKNEYVYGEKASNIIKTDDKKFSQIIIRYIEVYNVLQYPKEKIEDLLYRFIYETLNSNVGTIMELVNKQCEKDFFEKSSMEFSEEEKKIINGFLEWDDDEKNQILYRILSFSVDYCRMTVKQNMASFRNFFDGKVFFLDANIFYRLLGINNEEREKTVTQFVSKCKQMGILLRYSNYTKTEVFDSLEYNINRLKGVMCGISASPSKIEALMKQDVSDGLYQTYYKWAMKSNGFREFDEFANYIKNKFYSLTNQYEIRQVQFEDASEFAKESFEEKRNQLALIKGGDEGKNKKKTIDVDAQNIYNIRRVRGKNKKGNAWNINHFLISADHNLIKWSDQEFVTEVPLAVLPSVWYSIMLKLGGRTEDDYKAYTQFIKTKHFQPCDSNVSSILYNISQITDNRILQDKIIDNLIAENNNAVKILQEEEEVKKAVDKAYEKVLEETSSKSFMAGMEEGKSLGYEEGRIQGIKAGLERASIERELENINTRISEEVKKTIIRNRVIRCLPLFTALVFVAFQAKYKIIKVNTVESIVTYVTILQWFLPISIFGGIALVVDKCMPVKPDIVECKVRENIKSKLIT